MIWLAAQMWFLLIVAFALGVGVGVWMKSPRSQLPDEEAARNADLDGSLAADYSPRAPVLYAEPANGAKDDLTQIIGIDERDEARLNSIGVFHLQQIAEWGPSRAKWIEDKLEIAGRVDNERWVEQAKGALE